MLAKLDEYGSILLYGAKGAVGATLVACFQKRGPFRLIFGLMFERNSIAMKGKLSPSSLSQTIAAVRLTR